MFPFVFCSVPSCASLPQVAPTRLFVHTLSSPGDRLASVSNFSPTSPPAAADKHRSGHSNSNGTYVMCCTHSSTVHYSSVLHIACAIASTGRGQPAEDLRSQISRLESARRANCLSCRLPNARVGGPQARSRSHQKAPYLTGAPRRHARQVR